MCSPLPIKQDYNVCTCQVDSESSGPRAQQEDELGGSFLVELHHLRVSHFA